MNEWNEPNDVNPIFLIFLISRRENHSSQKRMKVGYLGEWTQSHEYIYIYFLLIFIKISNFRKQDYSPSHYIIHVQYVHPSPAAPARGRARPAAALPWRTYLCKYWAICEKARYGRKVPQPKVRAQRFLLCHS